MESGTGSAGGVGDCGFCGVGGVPLAGFTPQSDERRSLIESAREFDSDPLEAARFAYGTIGLFLRAGNFRPLGRFAWKTKDALVFEVAEATGLSLHSVHGVLRLVVVAALAMTAARVVAAVMRSAGVADSRGPLLVLYSLVLAVTLVAGDQLGPLVAYPVLLLGSSLLVLLVPLLVARDVDMRVRRLSWHEYPVMLLLGAAAAMFYDFVYLAPVLAAAFIAARAVASGCRVRRVLGTAAVRRWCVLAVGFSAVVVPTRVVAAIMCKRYVCYNASEIVLSWDVVEASAKRMISGAPPAGWSHIFKPAAFPVGRVAHHDYSAGFADLAGNWLVVVLLVVAAGMCLQSAGPLLRCPVGRGGEMGPLMRTAAALVAMGLSTVLAAALMVGLSKEVQNVSVAVGRAWRESLVVQVGWSFMIFAAIAAALGLSRRWVRLTMDAVLLMMLGVGLMGLLTGFRTGVFEYILEEPMDIYWVLRETRVGQHVRLLAGLTAIAAALALVRRHGRPAMIVMALAVLFVGMFGTLLANERLGNIDRGTPPSMLVRQMFGTVVRADPTEGGDIRRCGLVDAYSDLYPGSANWRSGPQMREGLDYFMLDRYGSLFCDRPGREEELASDPPQALEWITHLRE